jgi:hypothetical protein
MIGNKTTTGHLSISKSDVTSLQIADQKVGQFLVLDNH